MVGNMSEQANTKILTKSDDAATMTEQEAAGMIMMLTINPNKVTPETEAEEL
jgi:hypothetical protein